MTLRDADSLVDPASGYRLSPETNFDRQGVEVRAAESGAIRPDLVLQRQVQTPAGTLTWETVHVWDLKTGAAGFRQSWLDAVNSRLTPIAPPEIVRP